MINYSLIAGSQEWYEGYGFENIESPWIVPEQVSLITKPPNRKLDWVIADKGKVLVASGEQSFLDMYRKGTLRRGRFQTVTPCFRTDPEDEIHHPWFVKNELIDTLNPDEERLHLMLDAAYSFFSAILGSLYLEKVPMDDGTYDIEYKGIELGSYGIRQCEFIKWVYGTGCAEPRLSYCRGL